MGSSAEENPDLTLLWWGLGALAVAGASVAAYVLLNPPQSGSGGSSTTSPTTPTNPTGSTAVTLTSGAMTESVTPGASVTFMLPSGAIWDGGITATGNASIGSAPSSGNNPASLVYNGGGAVVTATWTQGTLLSTETTTITISDA